MTVTANTTRNDYTAGSAQSVYNYTFQLNEAADVDVYLDGVKQTLNTHYTVQNIGNASGGTITFTLVDANNNPIHPTQGAVINIVMAMDLDRDTNYQPSGAFLAADVNNDFDRLWLATNQQQTAINRSLRLQDDDVTTSSMELPLKDARKGKLLAFNATTGDPEATSNNQSNWDSAYNDIITSASFSGGNYTLTQRDGGTITTSLDGRYLKLSGGSVTGLTDFTEGLSIAQNKGIGFNGAQLVMGTSGTESFIIEGGTGDLSIDAANLNLRASPAVNYITATYQGAVSLYHDNSVKLATTSTGISVTGTLSATGYNDTNWNTAYGWGDHSQAGYLTSYTETDPVFSAHAASGVTATKISNWDTAYNNHITGVSYSGSTLTLTQQDGGTITTTINTSGGGGGGSSLWSANGSDIYYNSGNVGIGNSSPDNTLVVQGASTTGASSTGNVALFEGPSGTNGLKIFVDDTENATGLQTISADDLLLNPHGGKVGIGTSSPTNKLDVAGGHIGLDSGRALYLGSDSNVYINSTSSSRVMRLYTGNAERMRIDSSGNVGIGTTSPVSALDVTGTVTADGLTVDGNNDIQINRNGTSAVKLFFDRSGTVDGSLELGADENLTLSVADDGRAGQYIYFNNNTKRVMALADGGDISFYEDTGTTPKLFWDATAEQLIAKDGAFLKVTETDSSTVAAQLKSDSDEGLLQLYHNGAEKVRLRTNANSYFNGGNVGIGTTSPAQKLDVNSAGTTRIQVKNTNLTSSGLYIAEDGTGAQINEIGAYPLRFNTSGTERMRITSNGNVLVGTTSTSIASSGSRFFSGGNASITSAGTPFEVNRLSADGNIIDLKKDGTSVGSIGTKGDEFYIAHDGTTDTGLRFRGNGTIIPVSYNGNGADASQDLGASLYRFKDLYLSGKVYGDGSALTNLPASGIANVVEDTTPQLGGDLDLNSNNITGTGNVTCTKLLAGDGSASAPSYTFGDDTNTGMFSPVSDTIAFAEGGVERMRLNTSGQLIVGSTSGGSFGAKIRANGLIEGQGIKATSNSSAFYLAGNYGGASISVYGYTNSTTSTMKMLSFRNSSGTEKGSISVLNATTSYNTSSDERLKENIQDAGDAGSKIDAIRIRQFDWKEGGEHQDYGVIAQELQSVAPEAVTEGYNEEDMWSVDYSKLVPTLIKEIQSLRNRVAELENN